MTVTLYHVKRANRHFRGIAKGNGEAIVDLIPALDRVPGVPWRWGC